MATAKEALEEVRATREALKKAAATPAPRTIPLSDADGAVIDKANGILSATPRDHTVEKSFGFRSFGEYLHAVKSSPSKNQPSERLAKAFGHETVMKAAAGMGELIGSDGGFLVPPEFSNKIFERMYTENNLLAKTDQYTAAGNQMVFPRNNESSRATGSRWGGVRAYWVQEGDTITASSPTFGRLTVNLQKLACLARVTEELLQDSATSMPTYLTRVFSSEIGFASNNAIFRGTGAGQPLGLINGACAVTVSKETGQAAATIVSQNVAKMWARRFALGPTGGYVWLVNQDTGPQLQLMTLGIGTAGVVTYMPPGGLSGAPIRVA